MNSSAATNGDGSSAPLGGTDSPPPASRSQSISLQAAATMNAGLQRRSSSSSNTRGQQSPAGRRRSTVLMNLQLNDPSLPAPGEMQEGPGGVGGSGVSPRPLSGSPLLAARDPHHNRTPSLGELHQELEAEQEAQVNRLLQMIRRQQLELQQLQSNQGGQSQSAVVADDSTTPASERSASIIPPGTSIHPRTSSISTPRSPTLPRGSFDIGRTDLRTSRTPSRRASSTRMRSGSISGGDISDPSLFSGRDESAFYQAETQSLVRENQMLRHRIRELERQLTEAQTASAITREPVQSSQLLQSQTVSEEAAGGSTPAAPVAAATPKEE
ncbi:hypothetical protein KJ359_006116 [Pestalotiopsis sp. 9143b]|nr:hypothetical protein KJ359_006116 [Pestalotiopsis sp. 9143b]